jgi:hypothetical protein
MSSMVTRTLRQTSDHFEPEAALNPAEARKLRGYLEQIDFAAFAANREVIAKSMSPTDLTQFQNLAVAAAEARAKWVSAAVTSVARQTSPPAEAIDQIETLRRTYDELTAAYEAMRRMVERGYLPFRGLDAIKR